MEHQCHGSMLAVASETWKSKLNPEKGTNEEYDTDLEELTDDSFFSESDYLSTSESSDSDSEDDISLSGENKYEIPKVKRRKIRERAMEDEMEIRDLRKMLKLLEEAGSIHKAASTTAGATVECISLPNHEKTRNGCSKSISYCCAGDPNMFKKAEMMHELTWQCRDHYGPHPADSEAARDMQEDYENPIIGLPTSVVSSLRRGTQDCAGGNDATVSESEEGESDDKTSSDKTAIHQGAIHDLPAFLDKRPPSPCLTGVCGICSTCASSITSLLVAVSTFQHSADDFSLGSPSDHDLISMTDGVPSMSFNEALELSETPRLVVEASRSLRIVHANAALLSLFNPCEQKNQDNFTAAREVSYVGQKLFDVFTSCRIEDRKGRSLDLKLRQSPLNPNPAKDDKNGIAVTIFPVNDALVDKQWSQSSMVERKRRRTLENPLQSLKVPMRQLSERPSHLLLQFNFTTWLNKDVEPKADESFTGKESLGLSAVG